MPSRFRYRLFIDERGNHQMSGNATEGNRRLTIVGTLVEMERYKHQLVPDLRDIKRRYFSRDIDTPIVLHWEDIQNRSGVFAPLEDLDLRHKFNCDMVSYYRNQAFRVIAVVIDKVAHREKYGSDDIRHPYHYCVEVLLERYCLFLTAKGGTGDVFAEWRGKKNEDVRLQEEFQRFREEGTSYLSNDTIRKVISDRQIQFRTKAENVYGLQISDLLAPCCEVDVLRTYGYSHAFCNRFFYFVSNAIEDKYRCNQTGCPKGFGQILLSAEKTAPSGAIPTERATTA